MGYHVSEVLELKEIIFDYRGHEVLSTKGSSEHVSRLLSVDHVVVRWNNIESPEKSGSR
jgi:hypothetical protein